MKDCASDVSKRNHTGKNCRVKGKCGIGGCSKIHDRLLHEQEPVNPLNANANEFQPQVFSANESACIGLMTVPVIIKVDNLEVEINALLDDGSTKSFINEDIVAELGLCGKTQLVEVNVINGKTESFDAMTVNFTIQSTDKSMSLPMEAQTTRNVTGKLKPIDWTKYSKQWPHLKGINFPTLSKKAKVDLLIGLDYVELHRSLGEIQSERSAPVARLTPLGWTCVGPMKNKAGNQKQSLFTFHANSFLNESDTLKQFWEIENVPEKSGNNFSKKDNDIIERTEKLIRYDGERYEVPLPFKETKNTLPDNYEMAKSRLLNTEKKLDRNVEVKKIYTDTIKSYIEKGYVESIDIHGKSVKRWLLPHFPVVKMNRETTKVRIVFDASARCQGSV